MFDSLKIKIYQGKQYIENIETAPMREQFRGLPVLKNKNCTACGICEGICPTGALKISPLSIDMGKCTFCGACKNVCSKNAINFSNFYKLSSASRQTLTITEEIRKEAYEKLAVESRKEIISMFSKSLKLRQISDGGCGGCEMELNASSNVNFDMGRFGIDFVASPRHADGIVITGPLTKNMAYALEDCYNAIAEPKIIILAGACAISGGIYQNSNEIDRSFLEKYAVDLYIPGCPVHPLTFINGVLSFIRGRK